MLRASLLLARWELARPDSPTTGRRRCASRAYPGKQRRSALRGASLPRTHTILHATTASQAPAHPQNSIPYIRSVSAYIRGKRGAWTHLFFFFSHELTLSSSFPSHFACLIAVDARRASRLIHDEPPAEPRLTICRLDLGNARSTYLSPDPRAHRVRAGSAELGILRVRRVPRRRIRL